MITGGGPPVPPKKQDPFLQRILGISTSAVGLFNPYDSDIVPVVQNEAAIANQLKDFPDPPPEQEIGLLRTWVSRRRPTHSTSSGTSLEQLHKKKIKALEIQNKLAVEEMERAKALHEINRS